MERNSGHGLDGGMNGALCPAGTVIWSWSVSDLASDSGLLLFWQKGFSVDAPPRHGLPI